MKSTFTTAAAAAAVWALVTLPATAQSSGSGSAGSGSSQQGGAARFGSHRSAGQHARRPGGFGARASPAAVRPGPADSPAPGRAGRLRFRRDGEKRRLHTGSKGSRGSAATASSQDRTFIMEAAAGGMAEVELGRLASQKASRSEVKEFGQMMVDDHTKANNQLMKIAQEKGLAAPHALKPQDKATKDQLSKLSGEAFDRAYISTWSRTTRRTSLFSASNRPGRPTPT